jgi:hypothetical protein
MGPIGVGIPYALSALTTTSAISQTG